MDKNKTYVSLETAQLLKQAGFDWEGKLAMQNCKGDWEIYLDGVTHNWNDKKSAAYKYHLTVPTLDIAQKWLRDVKNCQIEIMYMYDKYGINLGKYIGIYTVQDKIHGSLADEESEKPIKLFEVYEKAQEALEQKILTILLDEEKK